MPVSFWQSQGGGGAIKTFLMSKYMHKTHTLGTYCIIFIIQDEEKKKIDWHDYKAIAEDEQRQGIKALTL